MQISRTGYTGDLGLRDLGRAGRGAPGLGRAHGARHGIRHPADGMLALDVARIEAGLLLVDVDFNGSRKSLIDAQRYSPYEMGLGRLVSDGKGPFVGRMPLRREKGAGPKRQVAGLEISWTEVEALYSRLGLPTQVPTTASRAPVPVYRGRPAGRQGDVHHLVTRAEEAHRAGHHRCTLLCGRHQAGGRDDSRGGSSPCERGGRDRPRSITRPGRPRCWPDRPPV